MTNNLIKEEITSDAIPKAAEVLMLLPEASGLEVALNIYLQSYEDASGSFHATSRHICINIISILVALILKLHFFSYVLTYINAPTKQSLNAQVSLCGRFENKI